MGGMVLVSCSCYVVWGVVSFDVLVDVPLQLGLSMRRKRVHYVIGTLEDYVMYMQGKRE